jgi:Zn-dependent protease
MFRLFGFPVHVRSGFVVFMALIVFLNGSAVGLWLAGGLTVFTLLHELGHAFAARATGADAEISLGFFAGYASFVPSRPLRRIERVGISLAGPAVHIASGVAVLAAMGHGPLSRPDGQAATAIWWAGPVIGAINLIPVLPLDGGNIALSAVEAIDPRRGRRIMIWTSIAVTAAAMAMLATQDRWRVTAIFLVLLLLTQFQMLDSRTPQQRAQQMQEAAGEAEATAWRTGRPGLMLDGQRLSPWFSAHQAYLSGQPDTARVLLLDSFVRAPTAWAPPTAARPEQLAPLVALLPEPLPTGQPQAEVALAGALLTVGQHERCAHYAADSYRRLPSAPAAVLVARAAAALADGNTAVGWLQTAARITRSPGALARAIDEAPEFITLRFHPDIEALRRKLAAA